MTEREFEQLRPWMDGMVTDVGYKPPASLIRKGWLRHEFDNFYRITPAGLRACADVWEPSDVEMFGAGSR